MKRFLIPSLMLIIASSAVFALGKPAAGTSHAQSGYDHKDMVVVLVANPAEAKRVWLVTTYSYPLLFSERDKLLDLVQAASKKLDIAIANKTTFSYRQDIGSFYTDNAALVSVAFDTRGYESSWVVVRIMGNGNSVILLLNEKDTRDFVSSLGTTRSLVDDYQRQTALFD
jgi:hypothetical protein